MPDRPDTSAPKFAVGEKVRHRASGRAGIVATVPTNTAAEAYRLILDFRLRADAFEGELEAAEPAVPATGRELQIGDRVAVEATVRCIYDGVKAYVWFGDSSQGMAFLLSDLRLVEPAPEGGR